MKSTVAGHKQARRKVSSHLLIHGARAVLRHAKTASSWSQQLSQHRPTNVVIVAIANKIARTIWAVLAHNRAYDKGHVSMRPQAAATW